MILSLLFCRLVNLFNMHGLILTKFLNLSVISTLIPSLAGFYICSLYLLPVINMNHMSSILDALCCIKKFALLFLVLFIFVVLCRISVLILWQVRMKSECTTKRHGRVALAMHFYCV